MTYWALNAVFLSVVLVVAVAAVVSGRAPRWRAVGLTGLAVLLLTAVFDNVMIWAGLFTYNPDRISGAFLGLAPLEDFAYAIAAVVLLPCLWHLLGRRGASAQSEPAASAAPVVGAAPAASARTDVGGASS